MVVQDFIDGLRAARRSHIAPLLTALFALLASAGAARAQIVWTSPANALQQESVPVGANSSLLCRAQSNSVTYLGSTSSGACLGVVNGVVAQSTNYELAVGLGQWDRIAPPNQVAFVGGTQGVTSIVACRALVDGSMVAGYRRLDQNTCQLAIPTKAVFAPAFETLYPLNFNDTFRLLTANNLCIIASVLNLPTAPKQLGCNGNAGLNFQIQSIGNNTYNLRNPAVNLCLSADGGSGTRMSTCGLNDAALKIQYANEGAALRLLFAGSSRALEIPLNLTLINTPLAQSTLPPNNGQYFQLRTLADSARRLSVMSYNIMLLNPIIFPGLRVQERAEWIPDAVAAQDPGLDVITIQETFAPQTMDKLRDRFAQYGYTFYSEVPDLFRTPGGVRIFSRWPILDKEVIIFPDCHLGSADCLADKGVTYARINKLGRIYHVFNTHLQADEHGNNYYETRRKQLDDLRTFINRKANGTTNEPVIVTCDCNVDMETEANDYADMMTRINATFFNAPRQPGRTNGPWTVSFATNDIAALRGAKSSWLDYILTASPSPQPIEASYRVKEYERDWYWMIVEVSGFGPIKYVRDLSDHSAVLASLTFPYAQVNNSGPTVPYTIRAQSDFGSVSNVYATVNGERVLLPATVNLATNQTHTITPDEFTMVSANQRTKFLQWDDSSRPRTYTVVNPDAGKVIEAYFTTEYLLTVDANPVQGGNVTGGGWYPQRTRATVTATPGNGFLFSGFTGSVTSTQSPVTFNMDGPRNITANFTAAGAPVLHVQTGARSDVAPNVRRVELFLRNAGSFPAVNARITGIGPIVVTAGGGQVGPVQVFPVTYGAINPGAAVGNTLDFNWPPTALRVSFTVFFAADGGYTGQTTITLIR